MEGESYEHEYGWEGAWLDSEFVSNWDRNYVIPNVQPEMRPEYHPTSYHVQSNAVRMILPAKECCLWDHI